MSPVVETDDGTASPPPVVVEAARSGRSKCRACKGPIAAGEVRFGREEEDDRQPERGRSLWRWYHLDCAVEQDPWGLGRALALDGLEFARKAELIARTREAKPPPARPSPALWWRAVEAGDVEQVGALIAAGAALEERDRDRSTALLCAAHAGDLALARVLLEAGADREARTPERYTPLHLAAGRGHVGLVDLLLASGAPVDPRGGIEDDARRTPLHLALEPSGTRAPEPIVRRLLEAGANPEQRDGEGWTCLLLAVRRGSAELCEMLLDAGARVGTAAGERWGGGTPLQWAARLGRPDIEALLRRRGAAPSA